MAASLLEPLRIYEANRMRPEDVARGERVRNDLERVIHRRYRSAEVLLRGSCLSGVGLRGCDVDISVESTSDCHLYYIAQLIRQTSAFTIFKEIYDARVPILILRHDATGSEVDVSLGGRSSVVMAYVMKALSELNPMLAPMIVVLKKWAKDQGLIWPQQRRFSGFIVTMMVVFHQQVQAGMAALAPSAYASEAEVRNLARLHRPNQHVVTNATLRGQIRDFFYFYGHFDFRSRAIDVRRGCLVSRPRAWNFDDMVVVHPTEGEVGGNSAAFVDGVQLARAQRAFREEL